MTDYICTCHKQMGDDFWFLPRGTCLHGVCDAAESVNAILNKQDEPLCFLGSDCLCKSVHGRPNESCDHYRRHHDPNAPKVPQREREPVAA